MEKIKKLGKDLFKKFKTDNVNLEITIKFTKKIPSVIELSEKTIPLVEEFFPKGECKERGRATMLHAKMLIAIQDYLKKLKE